MIFLRTALLPILGCLALAGCGASGKAANEARSEGPSFPRRSIQSPAIDPVTEADLGVPFYPGSIEEPGSAKIRLEEALQVSSNRSTTDPRAKVAEFYRQRLSRGYVSSTGETSIVTGKGADGEDYVISVTPGQPGRTTISILVSKTVP